MKTLNETLAARAGMRADAPYDRVIEQIRAAPPDELVPLVDELRQGVADLERVVAEAPSVTVAEAGGGDTAIHPRSTEHDDWVRRELGGGDEENEPPGLTVL